MHNIANVIFANASELGSIVAPILIAGMWRIIDNDRKTTETKISEIASSIELLKQNDLSIIKSKIHERIERCLSEGRVNYQELQVIESLYDRYRLLGGNSFISTGMEKVRQLPVVGLDNKVATLEEVKQP